MHEVWPVLFVGYRSKAEEGLAAVRGGSLTATLSSSGHVRRGAQFVFALEDGRVLAAGEIVKARKNEFELSLRWLAETPTSGVALAAPLLPKLKALLGKEARSPVAAFTIPIEDHGASPVDVGWFDEVVDLLPRPEPDSSSANVGASPVAGTPISSAAASEKGILEWLPPRLAPLLTGRVRADEWEDIVADALMALGLVIDRLGRTRAGESVPDCVAEFEGKRAGTYRLVVDAKNGRWDAPRDSLRAMREYVEERGGDCYPVFVVGEVGPDVHKKLEGEVFGHQDASVVTGKQLAEFFVRKLQDPRMSFELELRKLLKACARGPGEPG